MQLANIYDFPSGLNGAGQTIALIELNDVNSQGNATGAGYETSDLQTFFKDLGIPMPSVTPVGVDGGANVPGKDADADGEVTLDIEVAAGIAPGAKIVVYFGTNTDDGFIQVVSAAVHDTVRKPGIVSISWGQAEETATPQMLQGLQQIMQEAAALGVTVCVAAGDDGSADMVKKVWDKKPHVDFPASSPFALACRGDHSRCEVRTRCARGDGMEPRSKGRGYGRWGQQFFPEAFLPDKGQGAGAGEQRGGTRSAGRIG